MEEHLSGNLQDHFDPRFITIKVVGGSANEDAYRELCRRGREYLDSPDGVQKRSDFSNTHSIPLRYAELDRPSDCRDIKLDPANLALCELLKGMAGHIVGPIYHRLFGRDLSGDFFMSQLDTSAEYGDDMSPGKLLFQLANDSVSGPRDLAHRTMKQDRLTPRYVIYGSRTSSRPIQSS